MFGLLCANVHFKRMECVSRICAWKWCDLTYHTCMYETLRFFGQFGHNSGHFSGHLWPEVGPKSQNWSWQMAWGYSVAKIDLFWCATLGSLRIYHFWVIFWAFWAKTDQKNGRNWPNPVPMPKNSKTPKKYVKIWYFWYFIAKIVGALFLVVSYWNI